jgi:hypothetical protein
MVVVPTELPDSTPPDVIDATDGLVEDQVPPLAASVSVTTEVVQIEVAPEIVPPDGAELTVSGDVAVTEPQELVTV